MPLSILLIGLASALAGEVAAATRSVTPPSPPRQSVATPDQPLTVAVFGDRFGQAMASGLRDDLGPDTGFAVVDATQPSAGLLTFDWPALIAATLASRAPQAAVMMTGDADAAPLRSGAETVAFGSPQWAALYGNRVEQVSRLFAAAGVPLTWVGLPVVADEDRAAANATLNEVIRDRAGRAGAKVVDSWAAFADENGRFTIQGPDTNGRIVALRAPDGTGFTREGARRLASFVEGDLKRLRGAALAARAVPADLALPREPEFDNDVNAQIRRELGLPALKAPAGRQAPGPVVIVTAPPLAPDGQLVPATIGPAPLADAGFTAPAQRALVEGRPVPPRPGRIDDFSWPRHP